MNPDEIVTLADKSKCWFGSVYSYFDSSYKSNQLEEKADLYQKAANGYKLDKQPMKAGENFMKASFYYEKAGCNIKRIYSVIDAYNVYKNSDYDLANKCLKEILAIYTNDINCEKIMEYKFKLAELYKDNEKYDSAIDLYVEVMDVCETIPHCLHYKNKSILTVADIYTILEDYDDAGKYFEKYAYRVSNNNLLKLQSRENFFNACLCKLDNESIGIFTQIIDRYCNYYPIFETSRECNLLKELVNAINNNNEDEFTDAISEFDLISRLKDWQVRILLKIKKDKFNLNNTDMDDDLR